MKISYHKIKSTIFSLGQREDESCRHFVICPHRNGIQLEYTKHYGYENWVNKAVYSKQSYMERSLKISKRVFKENP